MVLKHFFAIIDGEDDCPVPKQIQESFILSIIDYAFCRFVSDCNDEQAITFLNELYSSATEALLKVDTKDLSRYKWATASFNLILIFKIGAVKNAE